MSLGLAGCLGAGGGSPGGTTGVTGSTTAQTETTAESPPEVREVDPAGVADRGVPRSPTIDSDTYEPFRAFVVGERPDSPGSLYQTPHVWVWNLTGESATMTVTVSTGGTELRRTTAEFPADAPLAVVFRDRGAYELSVETGDREGTVEVGQDRFRCNATGTDVIVKPDDVETGTVTTDMACTTTPGTESTSDASGGG
ncbi:MULTISPECIES: hypothetical protein [Halorussus]|uniref:hypothetical protein n=1 Tax=Halorussus TaxID=1070314 RepID=UPI000E2146B9|nr:MULTISPECIES: hypothetical protein [Halorussus]NHN59957.1 hypothetical protein [Halorussus sp. JP-T4]